MPAKKRPPKKIDKRSRAKRLADRKMKVIIEYDGSEIAHKLPRPAGQDRVQPRCKDDSSFIPEGYNIDEQSLQPTEYETGPDIAAGVKGILKTYEPVTVDFQFETGDRVKHRINGLVGIITRRMIELNGCERYTFETSKVTDEGKVIGDVAFVQELELVDKGLNKSQKPLARSKTGGPSTRSSLIERAS